MMKMNRYFSILIALTTTASVFSSATNAAVIYNNAVNSQNSFFGTANEFGDQIDFVGPERVVSTFKFDYYLAPVASGNETVTLRLYNNDGPGGSPSTMLYDSGPVSISKGYNTITADGLDLTVQDTLTWTVLFGGIESFEAAGLLLYDPPVLGKSFNDYWEKGANGTFALKTFVNDPQHTVANFGAIVSAVPEPGTISLALVGGLVWLSVAAKRRFSGNK